VNIELLKITPTVIRIRQHALGNISPPILRNTLLGE
jgi:hypothetical protein